MGNDGSNVDATVHANSAQDQKDSGAKAAVTPPVQNADADTNAPPKADDSTSWQNQSYQTRKFAGYPYALPPKSQFLKTMNL